jgi:hypothetical protein
MKPWWASRILLSRKADSRFTEIQQEYQSVGVDRIAIGCKWSSGRNLEADVANFLLRTT